MRSELLKRQQRVRRIYRFAYFAVLPAVATMLAATLILPAQWHNPMVLGAMLLTLGCLHVSVMATRNYKSNERDRLQADEDMRVSQMQMEELFAMTDMLQSTDCHEHAGAVLEATARRLLPDFGGALYVFNNSRDRLDLVRSWSDIDHFTPAETLLPASCWAIKRGKAHVNESAGGRLRCFHDLGDGATLEVPMMARGSLFGLLVLSIGNAQDEARLYEVERIARALADSMSLSLSNIALNDRLKTQSMRDPLTGLYNRRYMEDALERAVASAARGKTSTAGIMIDLDDFKRLNDEHGHAKGDAVLRDVAASLIGSLRPSDTVCRYGGEELFVILPNTSLDDAATRAEHLRKNIEGLSQAHGVPVSASLGVAGLPASVFSAGELIPAADSALYAAKRAGKNCVRTASGSGNWSEEKPPAEKDFEPRLVAG